MIDTGSFGVRVLNLAAKAKEGGARYRFGSGVVFVGPYRIAKVMIGGRSTAVPVQFVNTVECFDHAPHCPIESRKDRDYRIGGNGIAGEGFEAIIGIALPQPDSPVGVLNPLIHISHQWALSFAPTGQFAGALSLDPETAKGKGALTMPLNPSYKGKGGGLSNSLPGCLDLPTREFCGPLIIDSGSVGIRIQDGGRSDISKYHGPFAIRLHNDFARFSINFSAASGPNDQIIFPTNAGGDIRIFTGSILFERCVIFYNNDNHTITVEQLS